MGQSISIEEERLQKRVRAAIGTYEQFAQHLTEANEWAKLCPTPKTCRLQFRVIVNNQTSPEYLPIVWKMADNVQIEVRKIRREYRIGSTHSSPEVTDTVVPGQEKLIGLAKLLSVHQFYVVYCFLSDVRDCAAHSLSFPTPTSQSSRPSSEEVSEGRCDKLETGSNIDDDNECQICMDRKKEVVLGCTHSFCFTCYKNWSSQQPTCPICRSKIKCSEGEELWYLTFNEASDMKSEADINRSRYHFSAAAVALKDRLQNAVYNISPGTGTSSSSRTRAQSIEHIFSSFTSAVSGSSSSSSAVVDHSDYLFALSVASDDQFEAERQLQQVHQDQVYAQAMAMDDSADTSDNESD